MLAFKLPRDRVVTLALLRLSLTAEGDGTILPMWTSVEESTVCTPKEIWERLRQEGWLLDVSLPAYFPTLSVLTTLWHSITGDPSFPTSGGGNFRLLIDLPRIPISQSRRIEDNYLDSYVRVIQELDPQTTSLVFSCGAGAGRTTYAMCAAALFRRKQIMSRGLEDPFMLQMRPSTSAGSPTVPGVSSPPLNSHAAVVLEQVNAQQEFSRSLLKLAAILQESLLAKSSQNAIQILLSQPDLMDSLRKALLGNYGVVLSLLGCIDDGLEVR